jgi:uncharacterized membrane protein
MTKHSNGLGQAALDALMRSKGIIKSVRTVEEVEALKDEHPTTDLRARFTLFVASGLEPETGNFTDSCEVTVIAGSEEEACVKAYTLVRRTWYFIRQVQELD